MISGMRLDCTGYLCRPGVVVPVGQTNKTTSTEARTSTFHVAADMTCRSWHQLQCKMMLEKDKVAVFLFGLQRCVKCRFVRIYKIQLRGRFGIQRVV